MPLVPPLQQHQANCGKVATGKKKKKLKKDTRLLFLNYTADQ
jgi:hypothetical protein